MSQQMKHNNEFSRDIWGVRTRVGVVVVFNQLSLFISSFNRFLLLIIIVLVATNSNYCRVPKREKKI